MQFKVVRAAQAESGSSANLQEVVELNENGHPIGRQNSLAIEVPSDHPLAEKLQYDAEATVTVTIN